MLTFVQLEVGLEGDSVAVTDVSLELVLDVPHILIFLAGLLRHLSIELAAHLAQMC